MNNQYIAAFLGVFLFAIPSFSQAVDRDIRIFEGKEGGSTCIKVQVETTKECYCVDKYGKRTGKTCVYIKGASLQNDAMKK